MRQTDDIIYPKTGETRCNATAIRQAARHITCFYDAALAHTGLRGTQVRSPRLHIDLGPRRSARLPNPPIACLCTPQYDAAGKPLYTELQAGFPTDHEAL